MPGLACPPGRPRPDSADPPHHHGHRARLRGRFYSAGPDVLSGYELLETALPRRDTKTLLKWFGSFVECETASDPDPAPIPHKCLIWT
jgi:DNA repair protein RadC